MPGGIQGTELYYRGLGYEQREYQGVLFYVNPASGHVLTQGDLPGKVFGGRSAPGDPAQPVYIDVRNSGSGGLVGGLKDTLSAIVGAAATGWSLALQGLGYGQAAKQGQKIGEAKEREQVAFDAETQRAVSTVQNVQAFADAARSASVPGIDFGANAAQPGGLTPPAPDKTPASSPPVMAAQSPLAWLVLALALGFLVTR